jgi:hypothetical protein
MVSFLFLNCSSKEDKTREKESQKTTSFNGNKKIQYYNKVYSKRFGNCEDEKDCAELTILYPKLTNSGIYADSINNYILSHILNIPFSEKTHKDFNDIADSLISSYISVQHEFKDYHIGWFIHSKIEFVSSVKNIISVKSNETMYTGGANTYYNLTFANFDITNGTKLSLKNIFDKTNLGKVESIGKDIFIASKNIPTNQSFEEAGFWFKNNKFALNNNFAITDSGLVFLYNLYEIAPRSEGVIELFIPKEKLTLLTDIY